MCFLSKLKHLPHICIECADGKLINMMIKQPICWPIKKSNGKMTKYERKNKHSIDIYVPNKYHWARQTLRRREEKKQNIKIMMLVVWVFYHKCTSIVSIKISIHLILLSLCNHFQYLFKLYTENEINDINSYVPCKIARSSIKLSVFWWNVYITTNTTPLPLTKKRIMNKYRTKLRKQMPLNWKNQF